MEEQSYQPFLGKPLNPLDIELSLGEMKQPWSLPMASVYPDVDFKLFPSLDSL